MSDDIQARLKTIDNVSLVEWLIDCAELYVRYANEPERKLEYEARVMLIEAEIIKRLAE